MNPKNADLLVRVLDRIPDLFNLEPELLLLLLRSGFRAAFLQEHAPHVGAQQDAAEHEHGRYRDGMPGSDRDRLRKTVPLVFV